MSRPDNTYIHRIPFVRLLLPFLAGVILGLSFNYDPFFVPVSILVAGAVMYVIAFVPRLPSVRYRREPRGGAGILVMFLAAGWLAALLAGGDVSAKTSLEGPAVIKGYVLRPAVLRSRSEKVLLGVEAVRDQGRWYKIRGNAVLYFRKGSGVSRAAPGDVLLVRTSLHNFSFYGNPGEFDYRRYMNDRGFFWEGYVKKDAWCRLSGQQKRSLFALAARVRASLVGLLREHGLRGRHLAVAAALLAGEREYLDKETRTLFSASGVMHILAISGLHVGIIYLVLMWLFSPLKKIESLKYIRFFVILAALWGYAFITGLSPSVTRAALMFSLFLAADIFQRKNNPFNTLAVAAFLMLMINPLLVRDVAFQLSYLAVLGIVAFYRPFTRPLRTGLPLIDRLWSLVAVSLAAQVTTFPLTLYYFHRFSFLFPLTNILVIPLVTLFIYAGLLFFLLHSVAFVAGPLSVFLDKAAGLLLQITARAATIPHALIGPVWLRETGVLWFYMMILSVILLLKYRNALALVFLQGVVLVGAGGWLMREIQLRRTARVVVFHIPGKPALLLSYGDKGALVQNYRGNAGYYTDNTGGYLRLRQVTRFPVNSLLKTDPGEGDVFPQGILMRAGFYAAGSLSGYLLTDSTFRELRKKVKVDDLLFSGRKWWLVERQLRTVDADRIVLGSTVSSYAAQRIRERCPGKEILELRLSGPLIREERGGKIIPESFPLLCNFYTFASCLLHNQRSSRKKL